jgi:hypothetical protein
MPSTTSSSVVLALFSSTVITPSLPTLAIALAISLPISSSPLAEIVPTCATSSSPSVDLEVSLIAATTASTAESMPRLSSMGSWPAVTILIPSR